MQKYSTNRLRGIPSSLTLKSGPALRARVFLLCILTLLGTIGIASHVHEPISGALHSASNDDSNSDVHSHETPSDIDLESLIAEDCDQFHINALAAIDASPISNQDFQGREKGLVAAFSVDSISPELFPPARAPPSENSLT